MGIQCMETFIKNNSKPLKEFKLHDCYVILDGNSIYHQMYIRTRLTCIFGGEYDKFYRHCIRLFENFRTCKIKSVEICSSFSFV